MYKWLAFFAVLLTIVKTAYEPQLMLTTHAQFINELIASQNQTIIDKINSYPIKDIPPQEEKVGGVKISVNLTQLKQKIDIHWITNILTVVDKHTFEIKMKNVNVTLDAHLQAKIGPLRKQKGPLKIVVEKLLVDIVIMFDSAKCAKSIGFDVQIKSVKVNSSSLVIKIEGKGFDNLVIKQVQKLILPRIPNLIQKAIANQINPLLSDLSCNRIKQQIQLNDVFYALIVNTTQVPQFDDSLKYLKFAVDLTFQNMLTNQTNTELESDDLPGNPDISSKYQVSLSLSSNFLNTVMWLVGDAKLLHLSVTNQQIQKLSDNPPIALNTTNLTILLPNIKTKQWANKQVFLMIQPSTKFEHLMIRSGRIVTVLSLSIKFVVNINGNSSEGGKCILKQQCVVACDLNMTLPLSVALNVNETLALGLLHTVNIHSVDIIKSKIDINLLSLKSILNSIVGSMIPSLNSQLASGMKLDPDTFKNITIPIPNTNKTQNITINIDQLKMQTFQDYVGVGLDIDI